MSGRIEGAKQFMPATPLTNWSVSRSHHQNVIYLCRLYCMMLSEIWVVADTLYIKLINYNITFAKADQIVVCKK